MIELFERRGIPPGLHGVERLIAACARNDAEDVRAIASREPELVGELVAEGGRLLGSSPELETRTVFGAYSISASM